MWRSVTVWYWRQEKCMREVKRNKISHLLVSLNLIFAMFPKQYNNILAIFISPNEYECMNVIYKFHQPDTVIYQSHKLSNHMMQYIDGAQTHPPPGSTGSSIPVISTFKGNLQKICKYLHYTLGETPPWQVKNRSQTDPICIRGHTQRQYEQQRPFKKGSFPWGLLPQVLSHKDGAHCVFHTI